MKTRWHLLALAVVAFAVGGAFIREPGFGDDLTYWSFAFDLHERGLVAWQRASFHDLRWPVWGVCWLLQAVIGPGLVSYYGVPMLYLVGGALAGFAFGKKLAGSPAFGWACGIAFLFHPLLDTVSFRPMPDLSEGVWGGAIVLAWWALMNAPTRGSSLLSAAAMGAGITIIEANRVTGVFIVPVLVLCTLWFFPRRFGWVVVAGAIAAALYAGESAFYHRLFGDWLHDLTANSGNKGAKGTEFPNAWAVPFRFFDTLWKGNPLAPIYCILAAIGIPACWRSRGVLGRVIVVWFGSLYLLISCAPQSLWPYRPLVRDADRFLCALVVPMAVLVVAGAWSLGRMLAGDRRTAAFANRAAAFACGRSRQAAVGGVAMILMLCITSRDRFDLGFVPEMRRYLDALPAATRVFTHKSMREIVYLVDARAAARLVWTAPGEILHRTAELEAKAAQCSEFWYARKLVWLTTRKALEKGRFAEQPPLGSYFAAPEREWRLAALFVKGDTPDLIFYRRRTPGSRVPLVLGPAADEWRKLIPPLPARMVKGRENLEVEWQVPADLRGHYATVEFEAAAAEVEALTIRLRWLAAGQREPAAEYLLKPYLFPAGGKEFFAFPIPADAARCQLQFKIGKGAREVSFRSLRCVIEAP